MECCECVKLLKYFYIVTHNLEVGGVAGGGSKRCFKYFYIVTHNLEVVGVAGGGSKRCLSTHFDQQKFTIISHSPRIASLLLFHKRLKVTVQ